MRAAGKHADVASAIAAKRKVPCICDRQHDRLDANGKPIVGTGVCGRVVGFSTVRGNLHERVRCGDSSCCRSWNRIHG